MSGFEIVQWIIRIALAAAFVGMGVSHFRPGPRRVMAKMIPPGLRGRSPATADRLVLLTGVCEIAGGVGLLIPLVAPLAATALIVFLVAVFPANAYAAENPETFKSLAIPFWPRYLGQLAIILLLALILVPPLALG